MGVRLLQPIKFGMRIITPCYKMNSRVARPDKIRSSYPVAAEPMSRSGFDADTPVVNNTRTPVVNNTKTPAVQSRTYYVRDSRNTGLLISTIVLSCILFLVLLGIVIYCVKMKKRGKKKSIETPSAAPVPTSSTYPGPSTPTSPAYSGPSIPTSPAYPGSSSPAYPGSSSPPYPGSSSPAYPGQAYPVAYQSHSPQAQPMTQNPQISPQMMQPYPSNMPVQPLPSYSEASPTYPGAYIKRE